MPIYEYSCTDCGTKFEELVHRITNDTLPCPQCSSKNTQKLMSVLGGIAMKQGALSCQSACPSAGACSAAGGGCCSSLN